MAKPTEIGIGTGSDQTSSTDQNAKAYNYGMDRPGSIWRGLNLIGFLVVMTAGLIGTSRQVAHPTIPKSPAVFTAAARPYNTAVNVDSLQAPGNFYVGDFADQLGPVRDLQFSPGGTLLATVMAKGEVIALPDDNHDGRADSTKVILSGLNNPHGLAFYKGRLFVAETTRLVRYNWDEATLTATPDRQILNLPTSDDHITRSLLFVGNQLFVSIGSTCNVCIDTNPWRASVIVTNANGDNPRVFASGLRNGVFLAQRNGQVWTGENGRDYLGDNQPPDEINALKDGADYGWPFCYGNRLPDTSVGGTAERCQTTELPTFAIQAHSAPLGLAFIDSKQFPDAWQGDLLVAYHGSWNRSVPTGYKVVRIHFVDGQPTEQQDFITGFLPADATEASQAIARPVDLTFDNSGALYLSDDKSGNIFRVTER